MDCKIVTSCIFLILCHISRILAQSCDNGDIRLRGGPNRFEGRVEFCVNGAWGQVCGMGWTTDDAEVVCHQLGHSRAQANSYVGDAYGGTNQTAVATDVRCNENHTRLDLCPITAISDAGSCDTRYSGPAGVICRDPVCGNDPSDVRLTEDQVVEICNPLGQRTAVCNNDWDNVDATVVCRQLDLGETGVASSTEARAYRARLAYQNVNCSGNEAGLSDCPHSLVGSISECGSGSIARVQCQDEDTTGDSTPLISTTTAADTTPPVDTTASSTTDSSTTTASFDVETSSATPVETTPGEMDATTGLEPDPTTSSPLPPQETTEAGPEPQPNQSDSLLAIVLGVVLGLIALLLFGIVLLLILIVLGRKRRKYTVQYLDDSPNGNPMMMQVKGIEDSQLVNSYSSQKVDSERHLLNPLYLQNQQQLANSNPLPYTSVVTPPSTAGADSQIHDYATLDNFQPTVPQWPPQQPREYSDPTPPLNGEVAYYASSSGEAAAAYSEPLTQNGGYKVGEDGIVTDLQGYASLDPTAHHSYDYPQVNGEARVGTEGLSTLSIPQPYETPLESSYEDASSTNMSRSSTPLSARRESPKRREMDPVSNYTSLKGEEKSSPYAEHSPVPDVDQLSSPGRTVSSPTHDYATLEPPK